MTFHGRILTLRFFEVLVILPVNPSAAPSPTLLLEKPDDIAVGENSSHVSSVTVQVGLPLFWQHERSLYIRIRQGIDVDGASPTMIRKFTGPSGDIAAVEGGRVVRLHGADVVTAVILHWLYSLYQEAVMKEFAEDLAQVARHRLVYDECSCGGFAFEVPV